jgi:hypothetical protein
VVRRVVILLRLRRSDVLGVVTVVLLPIKGVEPWCMSALPSLGTYRAMPNSRCWASYCVFAAARREASTPM